MHFINLSLGYETGDYLYYSGDLYLQKNLFFYLFIYRRDFMLSLFLIFPLLIINGDIILLILNFIGSGYYNEPK